MASQESVKTSQTRFFLISEDLLSSVNKCTTAPSYRSDHSMVILNIIFTPFKKGKLLWKHNNSLLQDMEYLNIINEKNNDIKIQYSVPVYQTENIKNIPNNEIQFTINDQLFLETLLMEIRGKSISYSCFKKKENEKAEKQLIENIENLENNLSQNNIEELDTLRESLKHIRKIKMQGILIRTHGQIIEEDEKPSQYFCNLEKNNYSSKIIPKIERNDGTFITDQATILEETKLFYKTLYSSKDSELLDTDLEAELEGYSVPKLNIEESMSIEGILTYDQVSLSLKSMSNNKSPGTDGFSADFLKVFWGKIGHFVVMSTMVI